MSDEWDGTAECEQCGENKEMCCGSPKGGHCVGCCEPHGFQPSAGRGGYERSDCDQ